jgi:Clr5 domain
MGMVVRPEDYKQEILKLYIEEDYSQAQIIRHFQEQYGAELKRSTLSDFLKGQPKPGWVEGNEVEASERVLAPVGVRAEVQAAEHDTMLAHVAKATAEEVIDRMAQLIEGIQQLKREGDNHYGELHGKIDALRKQLRGEVPRSTLRRIWVRTVAAWFLVLTLFFVWQPTLIPTTALWVRGQGNALWSTVSGWLWVPSAVPAKPAKKAGR